MKEKKTLFAIFTLISVAFIGATIAYFASSADFENLFVTGTYRIVTTEVFESPTNWSPGQEIPKIITSTNEGTIPAVVRASITEQWIKEIDGVETDITNQVESGTAIINFANTDDWTHEGNYYYYNYVLNPNETTTSFIESVTLNPNLNGVSCTTSQDGLTQSCESNSPIQGATYKLTITKETVQADKYQEVWGTQVTTPPEIQQPPKIASCPGCVFAFYEDNKTFTDHDNYNNPVTRSKLNNYVLDYEQLKRNNSQIKAFLGHTLGNNDEIMKAYVCGIKDGVPFCVEGGVSDEESQEKYDRNTVIVQSNDLWGSTCEDSSDSIYCGDGYEFIRMSNRGDIEYYHYYGPGSDKCTIEYTGEAYCYHDDNN